MATAGVHWWQEAGGDDREETGSRGSDEESEDELPEGEAAADLFLEVLFSLMWSSGLSAKAVCTLCFWAHRAGAHQKVGKAGFNPSTRSTGHFQRHLDSVLGVRMRNDSWYTLKVPSRSKGWAVRQVRATPVLLPHGELQAELEASGTYAAELQIAHDNGSLPPLFYNHPGRALGNHALERLYAPLGIFIDGVRTIAGDAAIGFWLVNLITERRHLFAVLRKRCLCSCGCKGWCSYFVILDYLRWSLTALAKGLWPSTWWSGDPWEEGADKARAGQPMKFAALLVWIKADWGEWASSFGLANWSTRLWPCPLCCATQDDWRDYDACSADGLLWADTTQEDYEAACLRCEHCRVLTTRGQKAMVRGALRFDARTDGAKGRALTRDLPDLGLRTGDRVEADTANPDAGAILEPNGVGPGVVVEIKLWRRMVRSPPCACASCHSVSGRWQTGTWP